ncbi:MAG: hypothetical protein ACOX3T_03375 [Bdellovibrionota bacterium]
MEVNNIYNRQLADYYNFLIAQNMGAGTSANCNNITNMQNVMPSQNLLTQNIASHNIATQNIATQNVALKNIDENLLRYLSSTQANLNHVIPAFSGYPYTSARNAPLISGETLVNPRNYILGAIIIDPKVNELAGELFKANANNFSVNEWRAVVEQAILSNGGLGNSEDGFLAWSKDGHFVRLRNTNITPEQNQKLASMSLEFGWPVEDLPSNMEENIIEDPVKQEELNNKILDFETKIANFRQDPQNDFTVKYGKQRFTVAYDGNTGMFASRSYKLRSGIKGWFDKCAKKISTGLGIAKKVFSFIPTGWGKIVSVCAGVLQKLTDFYRARNQGYAK